MVILAHLHVGFSTIFFIKRALLKQFYLPLKLLQSRTTFKQKDNHEVPSHWNICMKVFTTPSSKNIIGTLRIVTIEKSELKFLLILYFHGSTKLVTLIAKWNYSSSPLEIPSRDLEATLLLYLKYRQTYLNTSTSHWTHKKTKKEKKKKRNTRNKMK